MFLPSAMTPFGGKKAELLSCKSTDSEEQAYLILLKAPGACPSCYGKVLQFTHPSPKAGSGVRFLYAFPGRDSY